MTHYKSRETKTAPSSQATRNYFPSGGSIYNQAYISTTKENDEKETENSYS